MLSSDLSLYRSSLHISCMFSHFLDSAFWALREKLLADLSNNWNYGQVQRKEEPSVLMSRDCHDLNLLAFMLCVLLTERDVSKHWLLLLCMDARLTVLSPCWISLLLVFCSLILPTPVICFDRSHSSFLSFEALCMLASAGLHMRVMPAEVCDWVSQCKSWNNLAFTVAHHDHELRALLTAFLVSVKRVLAICW